ncbi:MAG: Uncharacterized protein conserved in bacteria [uncultured Sulfurovum sp.]|uniref:Uncharacterized protein conserved in bacteria n=1 Tax=uncultured Sulfurovum sp. TaxID=269237 RepID=A0A6S6S6L7_9BACT|nr:MAG: Uncharacterized protein conserved in bacteria [uncultured Sulfurovum sp.]
MKIDVKQIYCGQEESLKNARGKTYHSSYKKVALNKLAYEINENGFRLDHQSDKESHGGIDKAICVYPLKNYTYLEEKYDITLPACAFGENLSIRDVDDSDICLGDKFTYGETIVEVSQPRQPCWKISSIVGIKKLTAMVVKEHKSGFYLRVLEAGKITPSDKMELISRDYPKFTIEFINQIAFNAKENQKNIKEVLECEKLAEAYRISLEKRYQQKEVGLQAWQEDDYN